MKSDDIARTPSTHGPPRSGRAPFPRWSATQAAAGGELTPEQTGAALEEERSRRVDAEERAERLAGLLSAESERREMAERQARALGAQMRALDRGVVKQRRRGGRLRRLLSRGGSD